MATAASPAGVVFGDRHLAGLILSFLGRQAAASPPRGAPRRPRNDSESVLLSLAQEEGRRRRGWWWSWVDTARAAATCRGAWAASREACVWPTTLVVPARTTAWSQIKRARAMLCAGDPVPEDYGSNGSESGSIESTGGEMVDLLETAAEEDDELRDKDTDRVVTFRFPSIFHHPSNNCSALQELLSGMQRAPSRFSQVKRVFLANYAFTDNALLTFGQLFPAVKELHVDGEYITGRGLIAFSASYGRNVEVVQINSAPNIDQDSISCALENMPYVKSLFFRTDAAEVRFSGMKQCRNCNAFFFQSRNTESSCLNHPGEYDGYGHSCSSWSCCGANTPMYLGTPGCKHSHHQEREDGAIVNPYFLYPSEVLTVPFPNFTSSFSNIEQSYVCSSWAKRSSANLDLYSPLTLADDLKKESPPEKRAVMYHLFQQRFLHLAAKHSLVSAAASGRPRDVARLAAAVPPGHELDDCNQVQWNDLRPLYPPAGWPGYYTHWYTVVHVCAVLGHVEEMDAVLEAWVPRGTISGTVAGKHCTVAAADYMVNYGVGSSKRTPLMLAVANGHGEVVRRLMGRWGAAGVGGVNLMGPMWSYCFSPEININILHLAVSCAVVDCVDAIMSGVDEAVRLKLVGMEVLHRTPLELALYEYPHRQVYRQMVKMLANPKWGESVIQAMDSRWPILYFVRSANEKYWPAHSEEVLNHLCGVFSRGLAAAYFHAPKKCRALITKHPKFVQSIDEISPKTGDTVLYKATIKGDTESALEALSFGADPNIQCRRNPTWCDFPEELRTPIVMAVASEQKEVVKEMARHGGVLPLAFCNRIADSAFSLEAYIDGTWDKHIATIQTFRKSLPAVKWNYELRGSTPFDLPPIHSQTEFAPGAETQFDMTQMMVQYNTEITGVMEFLDIQSLSRVQQTSRFWYQCGRTNSLWKRALFNSSREWSGTVRHKVNKCLELLPEATTKWKHVCFFWAAKNQCTECHEVYRNCDIVHHDKTSASHHVHHPHQVRFFSGSSLLDDILWATHTHHNS
ncbi:hypothetical protein Pelo_17152 [Pelomyxa schiedti]|nr:hypothetical protein Pelo_17152 [Pelomyxa schiedti]